MADRPPPPQFFQPKGSAKCWAYALASWLQVTPGRPNFSPEDLVRAAVHADRLNGGAITPKRLIALMESNAVNMQWKIVDGNDLTIQDWNRMLNDFGYVYAVLHEKTNTSSFAMSHARVVYAAVDDEAVAAGAAPLVTAVDPQLADFMWTLEAMKREKILLGVAPGDFLSWYPGRDDGWHKATD